MLPARGEPPVPPEASAAGTPVVIRPQIRRRDIPNEVKVRRKGIMVISLQSGGVTLKPFFGGKRVT